MQQDLKDFLPDLDAVLKQADRDSADKKHRLAVEPLPAKLGRASAPPSPTPSAKSAGASRRSRIPWKAILIGVVAVALPCAVFVVLYEKARGASLQSVPAASAMATEAASAASPPTVTLPVVAPSVRETAPPSVPEVTTGAAPSGSIAPNIVAPSTANKPGTKPVPKSPPSSPTAPSPAVTSSASPPAPASVAPQTVLPTPKF